VVFKWHYPVIKVKVTLRLTGSQSVSLGVEPHLGLMIRYFLLFNSYGLFYESPSLTRGRVCLLYMLLVLGSVVFLGSESLGTHDHIFTVSDLGVPFLSPPTTRRVIVEVFDPASTRAYSVMSAGPRYIDYTRTAEKIPLPTIVLLGDIALRTNRTENTVSLLHCNRCCVYELFTMP
jgi:hypothetical protein